MKELITKTLRDWERVIKLSRKPRKDEFIMISKVTGLGMLVVGVIGFTIRMLITLLS
ncbi:MAG: protein translocase SEC61 complex subunit gamma [Candidatus Hydrothermarchaeales archaeon]